MMNALTKSDKKFIYDNWNYNKIIKSIYKPPEIWDYPKAFMYIAELSGLPPEKIHLAYGISFFSPEIGILKCIGESFERYSLYSYNKKNISVAQYNSKINMLSPLLFDKDFDINNKYLGWTSGYKIKSDLSEELCRIPAQLLYLNYQLEEKDVLIRYPNISNGAAGGKTHESTLLRGIYELVERDAFMCVFLNKIKAPLIKLSTINSPLIKKVIKILNSYKLEVYIADLESDLNIPAFLSMIVDETGVGPKITCGLKAGVNIEKCILGSLEEAFMIAVISKIQMTDLESITTYKPDDDKKFKSLEFLFNQQPSKKTTTRNEINFNNEYSYTVNALLRKNHFIYYADITPPFVKGRNYLAYKVLIPTLQPLYYKTSYYNLKRLQSISKHFHQKNFILNTDSIPFL